MNVHNRQRCKTLAIRSIGDSLKAITLALFAATFWLMSPSVAFAEASTNDVRVKAVYLVGADGTPGIQVRFLKSDGSAIASDNSCSTFWVTFPTGISAEYADRLLSMLLTAQAQQSRGHVTIQSSGSSCVIRRFQIEH